MSELASETLHLVSAELANTLQEARQSLEAYAEHPDSQQPLRQCARYLHTAQGVLRMVEVYGAALLAEEMEHVAEYLIERGQDTAHRADALDALMRSMVQLPAYLERVLGGGRDVALVLLPLLNDLRAVRGFPLLSEGTLLLLNLRSDAAPAPPIETAAPPIRELARKLRPRYQLALLGWIRGEQPEAQLEVLASIAERLERAATEQPVYQLWWVTGAVLEALREDGLEPGVSIKRLLGQADRELKRLIDRGERVYATEPLQELLNNLLYYVARALTNGPRVAAVRSSFNLREVLPAEEVERARANLSAPSIKLMRTVAEAIKEDLSRVKDVLDIYVRTGMGQVEELAPQLELLKKIADTLGVLGLGDLRGRIQGEIRQLQAIISAEGPSEDSVLIEMAATLLSVEDSLDEHLMRIIRPPEGEFAEDDEFARTAAEVEFQQVTQAVIRECIVNLARVKEAIAQWAEKPENTPAMDAVPTQLRGITAALLMLGRSRAVELVERVNRFLGSSLRPGRPPLPRGKLERLADAIVSLEYYMETVQAGRRDPWYMLDNADACLKALQMPEEIELESAAAEEPPAVPLRGPATEYEPTAVLPAAAEQRRASIHAPVVRAETTNLDPEFLELFIEEAREEIVSIGRCFAAWAENPNDAESLVTLRRSFHTLKGSGRLVGAQLVGEFAWAIENLLNRVINRTLPRSPAMIALLERALGVLPELIEQLETGRTPSVDVAEMISVAEAFASGDSAASQRLAVLSAAIAPPEAAAGRVEQPAEIGQPQEPIELAAESATEAMDPVLHEIFSRETAEHLRVIKDYLASCEGESPPYPITEAMYRSIHTLAGSTKMAGATQGVKLVEPLNRYVRKLFDHAKGLPEAGRELCARVIRAIEDIVTHINEGTGYFRNHPDLITELLELEAQLDREITAEEASETGAHPIASPVAVQREAPGEYDAEIAAIFCDEATELLEGADTALARWREERGNPAHTDELHRHLHTLKGGARMSGVRAMGDLCHELESLLADVQSGRLSVTPGMLDLVQDGLDCLHQMREAVSHGMGVAPAQALLERIRRLAAGEIVAVATAEPLHAAPHVEPLALPGEASAAPAPWRPEPAPRRETAAGLRPTPREVRAAPSTAEPFEPAARVVSLEPLLGAPPADARAAATAAERVEHLRVSAELLDQLLNNAGEISIFRSRLEQQINSISFNLAELSRIFTRLREQLRLLEMETEAQILHRHQEERGRGDFDPLELDRYSTIQQFSRALAESVGDVGSVQSLLENLSRDAENLLVQQARVTTELQNGLMRTRMVPFERHAARLARLVRQAAAESGKRAELLVEGGSGELDRQVLERMLPPFEHMLRNAVIHGIEPPAVRLRRGKPETGRIRVRLRREGAEMVIEVTDDGAGMNVRLIREKALAMGLIDRHEALSDEEAMQLVLRPGFSTAGSLTQSAGRGVGMDVVASEVKKLGGSLSTASTPAEGTTFTVRLPFTLAITQALIVRTGEELYALPLPTVEGVVRIPLRELKPHLEADTASYEYGGQAYRFEHLGVLVGGRPASLPEDERLSVPVILVKAGEHSTGLITDELTGSREIVVKSVGPQIAGIRGISGATILGDGRIAIILDVGSLVRGDWRGRRAAVLADAGEDRRTFVLVVDDSITVRRVTQRLLERNGMRVMTAKDGVDAVSVLQEHTPDAILLDIEMPRMDGYEVASHVRNDQRLKDVPIIMITSRAGEKHRARAIELGVDDYLGKPYQESQLLDAIEPLVRNRR